MLRKNLRLIILISGLVIMLMVVPLLSGCGKVAEFSDPVAENILLAMNNADYDKFSKDFDQNLKAELSEEAFPGFLAQVNGQIGDYRQDSKKITGVEVKNDLTQATYEVDFEGMEDVTFELIFSKIDGEMKVVGLWFR